MIQAIEYIGMVLILLAFSLNAMDRWQSSSRVYLTFNAVGSTFLFVAAYTYAAWGFFILNVVWALVAYFGLGTQFLRKSYL